MKKARKKKGQELPIVMTNPVSKCVITDMFWERIFLHIVVRMPEKQDLFLYREVCDLSVIRLDFQSRDDGLYELVLNMSIAQGRSFLGNGYWRIGYFDNLPVFHKETGEIYDERVICRSEITEEFAYKAEQLDKIFRYGNRRMAYTVNFYIYSRDDVHMHVAIGSFFMKINRCWEKRSPRDEANSFKSYLRRQRTAIIKWLISLTYRFLIWIVPHRGNRILLIAETKEQMTGNLAAFGRRLYERGLDRQFYIDYVLRVVLGKHNGVFSWLKTVIKIARADYIFADDYVPIFAYLDVPDSVEFVQLWHAGGGFKAVGYCRFGKSASPFPLAEGHRKYTKALAPSKKLIKIFGEVFGIEDEAFLPWGLPRLDGFLDKSAIRTFRKTFFRAHHDWEGKEIILFAPTYRGSGQRRAFYDYTKLDLQRLYEFCGDSRIVIFKMHPFITGCKRPDLSGFEDRLVDFSDYPDINQLFYVADVLITDYSSAYYEFALLKKPILFYVYDCAIYETTRGVFQSVRDSAPGKVVETFDDLLHALKSGDYEIEKTLKFAEDISTDYEGNVSDRLIDAVLFGKTSSNDSAESH
jgi:CDP-ribitol ribitolphosphotransferase